MAQLAVNLLGGFRAVLDSGAPCALPTKKAQALLAYLALAPGRAYPRDGLASLLWCDRGAAQARKSLRQTVYELRKAVPDARRVLLDLEGEGIALNPVVVEADVPRFETLVRERTPAALEEAAALYRGDLLHGFVLEETEFEEWLMAERERLRELAIEGLANLLRRMRVCRPNESRVPSRLKRPGEQRATPPIGLPVPEAPLIGRSSELTRLQDLLRQAEEGQERVAIVLGEAGIGKTRLLAEIAGWALDTGSQRPTIPSSRGSLRGFSSCPLQ